MPNEHKEAQAPRTNGCAYCGKKGTDVRLAKNGLCVDCASRRETIAASNMAGILSRPSKGGELDLGAAGEQAVAAADSLIHHLDKRREPLPSS